MFALIMVFALATPTGYTLHDYTPLAVYPSKQECLDNAKNMVAALKKYRVPKNARLARTTRLACAGGEEIPELLQTDTVVTA